jgi:hypothetical protein
MTQTVNIKNWSYSRFIKDSFMAFISFGSSPDLAQQGDFEYFVTVLENSEKEIFQMTFSNLAEACLYLNQHYGDWSFEDQTAPKSGCSTCAAH